MALILDIETDSLHPSKIHLCVTKDLDTGVILSFQDDKKESLKQYLNKFDNEDDIWDEIAISMAWIEDALGMKHGKATDMFDERDRAMERYTSKLKNKLKKLK